MTWRAVHPARNPGDTSASPTASFLELAIDLNAELGVREVLERTQATIEGYIPRAVGIAHAT